MTQLHSSKIYNFQRFFNIFSLKKPSIIEAFFLEHKGSLYRTSTVICESYILLSAFLSTK